MLVYVFLLISIIIALLLWYPLRNEGPDTLLLFIFLILPIDIVLTILLSPYLPM